MIFYSTEGNGPGFKDLGFVHNPFLALVVPRPIGWISSVDKQGIVNLAPFSFFNAISSRPPMVFFGANGTHLTAGGEKDSGGCDSAHVRSGNQTEIFWGFWASWVCLSPAKTRSLVSILAAMRFFGSIPLTACSMINSGWRWRCSESLR